MSRRTLGILRSGASLVALDARHLREVVPLETRLAPRPLAPAWELGSFTLRETAIPAVDLGRLLQLDDATAARQAGDQVAVVSYRGGRFGLCIDEVCDVLEVEDAQLSALGGGQGKQDALTPWMLAHPTLDEPVYVLDNEALFALEGMAVVVEQGASEGETSAAHEASAWDTQRQLVVATGQLTLAIAAERLREILPCGDISAPRVAVDGYLGDLPWHQAEVPIFDPQALIGAAPMTAPATQAVVLDGDGGQIALAVTTIHTLIDLAEDDRQPLAGGQEAARYISGALRLPELGEILCLDVPALFAEDNHRTLAKLHAQAGETAREQRTRGDWQRFAFVHFDCAGEGVTPLEELEAVCSPTQIRPLRTDGPFCGVMHHLQRPVSVVDLRALLGRDAQAPAEQVLIVDSGEGLVGFLVDRVSRLDYLEAPKASYSVRWRGDARDDASPLERAKRLIAVGEGARQQILAILCLRTLARALVKQAPVEGNATQTLSENQSQPRSANDTTSPSPTTK